ncbi:MAG: hypothetical protein JKY34_15180 [Kordiimonadaceae bacterium]|nr:hypothetical protein [Kordiimonadaceae bacterium]
MIDQVSKAIKSAFKDHTEIAHLSDGVANAMAHKAIEAMREPTDCAVAAAMVAALELETPLLLEPDDVEKIIAAMIDAELVTSPPPTSWRVNEPADTSEQERMPYQEVDNGSGSTPANIPPMPTKEKRREQQPHHQRA